MKTSAAGRALIAAREGRSLSAYRDRVGVWTIGVGHTGRMAPPRVTPGMTISDAQCESLLIADLAPVERVLDAKLTVPVTQNEFDALASLGFNIGVGGLTRSSVIKRLNQGDVRAAADAFLAWSRPAVLVERRKAERAQFLKTDTGSGEPAKVVMARRAEALLASAEASRADASQSLRAAAAVGAVSAAAAVAQPVASHYHGLLWLVCGLALAGATCAAAGAVRAHRRAAALDANAGAQTRTARRLDAQPS